MENKGKLSATTKSKTQSESKYDSHSEEKPTQKTTVVTDSNPDRVSHDNTDDYLQKLPLEKENAHDLSEDATEDNKKRNNPQKDWDASFYPDKRTSLQGN